MRTRVVCEPIVANRRQKHAQSLRHLQPPPRILIPLLSVAYFCLDSCLVYKLELSLVYFIGQIAVMNL